MVSVESWYNTDLLTPAQITELDGALHRDLAALAEMDNEPEADGAEAEAG